MTRPTTTPLDDPATVEAIITEAAARSAGGALGGQTGAHRLIVQLCADAVAPVVQQLTLDLDRAGRDLVDGLAEWREARIQLGEERERAGQAEAKAAELERTLRVREARVQAAIERAEKAEAELAACRPTGIRVIGGPTWCGYAWSSGRGGSDHVCHLAPNHPDHDHECGSCLALSSEPAACRPAPDAVHVRVDDALIGEHIRAAMAKPEPDLAAWCNRQVNEFLDWERHEMAMFPAGEDRDRYIVEWVVKTLGNPEVAESAAVLRVLLARHEADATAEVTP